MEKDLMVKTLIKKGNGFIVESRKASEISTGFSLPVDSCTFEDSAVAVASKKIVKHEDMNWITKEQLWTEIQRINNELIKRQIYELRRTCYKTLGCLVPVAFLIKYFGF